MMHHQNVDFTKLFSRLDVIICSLIECRDSTNTLYYLTIGFWNGQILLKLEPEEDISIYRFELNSARESKKKMEWIIDEKKLAVKAVTYFFDGEKVNITSDFYRDNQIQYTFDARSRSSEPIRISYKLHILDPDYQELCDNYVYFMAMLYQNERGLAVTEVSPHPNKLLRKCKLQDLLSD